MYTPTHFLESNRDALVELIDANNFGTLISTLDGRPYATHLPFVHETGKPRLIGHMARANPHWQELAKNPGETLVLFQGPHAYVSPTWYVDPGVPTWNYTAVHVYGDFRVLDDEAEHTTVLHELTERHESARPKPWRADFDSTMIRQMIRATVAFEIVIDRYEGKFKLSQNRSHTDQTRVIDALTQAGGENAAGVAELMSKRL